MKKSAITLMLLLISASFCFSQDIITKKSGEDIQAKILEVTQTEIRFKKFSDLEGPSFSINKSDILMIRYKNGTKDIFNEEKTNNNDMASKGKNDAKLNYKGGNSGAGWTAATSILTSPILGLIPAAICSSAEPKDENLNYKDVELMKNSEYNKSYSEEAHRIKKRKVWTNYGIGSGAWLVLLLLL
jgi:hypothetical protein